MERVLVDGLDRDHAYISYKCTMLQATLFLFDRCEVTRGQITSLLLVGKEECFHEYFSFYLLSIAWNSKFFLFSNRLINYCLIY